MPIVGAFRDAKLGDQGRLEARRGGVRLSVVVHRVGNPFELVFVERPYLIKDRRLVDGLGFRFELAAQVCDPELDQVELTRGPWWARWRFFDHRPPPVMRVSNRRRWS